MKKYKSVIVGLGRIVKKHIEALQALSERVEIAGVCDINEKKAENWGQKLNVPYFTDYHKMFESLKNVDIAHILTPSGLHAAHTIDISSHVKNIICEKPMALMIDDADKMISACDRNGCRLFVVKQNRYNLPVKKLREAVEEGRFGKMVLGTVRVRWCRPQEYYDQDEWRGTWAMDGGVLTNQASHHIDLLEWMMGDVVSVFARSATRLVNIEVEDTAVATLKFKNGALGIIEATTATRPKDTEGSISILGENGMVEIGGFAVNEMKTWQFAEKKEGDDEVISKYRNNPENVYGFGHIEYISGVLNAIESGKHALVEGLEGRRSLELINALYESIETGNEVFLRFEPKKCRLGH